MLSMMSLFQDFLQNENYSDEDWVLLQKQTHLQQYIFKEVEELRGDAQVQMMQSLVANFEHPCLLTVQKLFKRTYCDEFVAACEFFLQQTDLVACYHNMSHIVECAQKHLLPDTFVDKCIRLKTLQLVSLNLIQDMQGKYPHLNMSKLLPSETLAPELKHIRIGLQTAKNKYQKGVYNLTVFQLANEFGNDVFPRWITRFHGLGNNNTIPLYFQSVQLSYVTEHFCYLDCDFAADLDLQPCEIPYLLIFASVFRYDFCFLDLGELKATPKFRYCKNDSCCLFASQHSEFCKKCEH